MMKNQRKIRVRIVWGTRITRPAKAAGDTATVELRFRTIPDEQNADACNALEKLGLHVKRRAFGAGCWSSAVLNPPKMKDLPQQIEL